MRVRVRSAILIVFLLGLFSSAAYLHGQARQVSAPNPAQKNKTNKTASAEAQPLVVARREYVGDAVCAKCHAETVESYHKTAHFLTSQEANHQSVAGTFAAGTNVMTTANPNLSFLMEEKNGKFFETAIFKDANAGEPSTAAPRTRTERFDMVIGSGRKGQTYLFWKDEELYQLPIGYSTFLHHWINGPGYVDGTAKFDRPIIPRCLECHAAYFEAQLPGSSVNLYNRKNYELGISCERCHGPGRTHVENHAKKAAGGAVAAGADADIVNPAKLSTARKEDVCALCHGGQGEKEFLPAFSFVPGQPLEKYIDLGTTDSATDVDVHGKQGKLLMKSQCFKVSGAMTCSTCHNVHQPEPDLTAMSQHCLTCHKLEPALTSTETHAKVGAALANNCVDCHMPTLESKVVNLDVDGQKVRPRFRSHWIRVYSETERR